MPRGRKPKPTALRLIEGNPGKRPINREEPKPPADVKPPKPPSYLGKLGKKEWKRVAKELTALRMLTALDHTSLAVYCSEYERWREALEFLREKGSNYIVRDKDGQVKYVAQFPQVSIASNLEKQMRAWASEFGFSPAARTRLKVEKKDTPEAFRQFLNKASA
jgi:P27 family predicted phage terminase small subunit